MVIPDILTLLAVLVYLGTYLVRNALAFDILLSCNYQESYWDEKIDSLVLSFVSNVRYSDVAFSCFVVFSN
jgi:hypothetical protein